MTDRAAARAAKSALTNRLSGEPGVVGIGLARQANDYVLKVDLVDPTAAPRVPENVDADVAAHLLLAAWEGLQLQWMQGPPFDIRALIESHIRALLGPDALD